MKRYYYKLFGIGCYYNSRNDRVWPEGVPSRGVDFPVGLLFNALFGLRGNALVLAGNLRLSPFIWFMFHCHSLSANRLPLHCAVDVRHGGGGLSTASTGAMG